jgi:hypothetical protein
MAGKDETGLNIIKHHKTILNGLSMPGVFNFEQYRLRIFETRLLSVSSCSFRFIQKQGIPQSIATHPRVLLLFYAH